MYINEQYHDLPLLETKEYRFISRDGQLISKQEQILKEHLIDVYLNDHLTMKLGRIISVVQKHNLLCSFEQRIHLRRIAARRERRAAVRRKMFQAVHRF